MVKLTLYMNTYRHLKIGNLKSKYNTEEISNLSGRSSSSRPLPQNHVTHVETIPQFTVYLQNVCAHGSDFFKNKCGKRVNDNKNMISI